MAASVPDPFPKPQLDRLEGLVERFAFHDADAGFCVLRLKVKGERELITLVGHAPTVASGSTLARKGHGSTNGSMTSSAR